DPLSWHGRGNLLAALRFRAAVAATPRTRIEHLGGEFEAAGLQLELPVGRRRHANLVRLSWNQYGEGVRCGFDDIGKARFPIECGLPAIAIARKLDNARFAGNADLVFHGMPSSCCRRPSLFQRDEVSLGPEPSAACPALCRDCQMAAAMAAASRAAFKSASPPRSEADRAAARPGRNSSSIHRV